MSMYVGLGSNNRFLRVTSDNVRYRYPIKKVDKIKRHIGEAQDLAFLPDEQLVVSDRQRNAIKIFEADGHKRTTLMKDVRPIGISATQSGMVAFIDGKRQKEKYVKIFSSGNPDHLFSKWGDEMDWKPRGLTFNNKGHLVITNIKTRKHSIGTYTLDGRLISTFGTQGSHAFNFNYPNYVAVDMFDRVIVSDMSNNVVKVFDDRGGYLGMFGDKGTGNLYRPRGVCTDSRGNIIVCDTGNRRVCVFSLDGRHIQDLLTKDDGIDYPYAVACDRASRKLVVSQYSSSEKGALRKIRFYELDELPPLDITREK